MKNATIVKKDIMSYAWKLAKEQAVKDNCTARECFAWALKKAWGFLKELCTAHEGFHKNSRYGSFCRWDSDFADIADNFPNVCSKKWGVFDNDSKNMLYVGTLSECEKFRWSPSFFEHFGHLKHIHYTQGFYCPLLWT
jgi:hypothetical protein